MKFDLTPAQRTESWLYLTNQLESYYANTESYKAAIDPSRDDVKAGLVTDFDQPLQTREALDSIIAGLSEHAIHTPHPMYYGMFNPRANFPSILADTITATFNPQLAAWGHAPFAVEVEHLLIQKIGGKMGYPEEATGGTFTTGGQEANLTAVLAALFHKFDHFGKTGVRGLSGLARIYVSESSHHATVKAARICGLGLDSVRYIKVDDNQVMKPAALRAAILQDLASGYLPTLVVATMGTTGVGAIDPIEELSEIAAKYELWLHADAAYGGGLALSGDYKDYLEGIELADSITFDAHKWLSVPMATSMFVTRHPKIMGKVFSIKSDYMPDEESEIYNLSPYANSIQWSRRFIGLKLYISLLVFGWEGYSETIDHQIRMGALLRKKLEEHNWTLRTNSILPIVCFADDRFAKDEQFATNIYESFLKTGESWINKYPVGDTFCLRACITNYATEERHLDALVALLNTKRNEFVKESGNRSKVHTQLIQA